jgi:nitrate reductase NapAB chaperone NapD
LRSLKQYLSNHCETTDKHEDELLRTHYYKTTSAKALKIISDTLQNIPGFHITSISEDHGEMSVNITSPKKGFLVVSVVSVRPLETAIDFSVTYEGFLGFGLCKKVILKLYNLLDQQIEKTSNSGTERK